MGNEQSTQLLCQMKVHSVSGTFNGYSDFTLTGTKYFIKNECCKKIRDKFNSMVEDLSPSIKMPEPLRLLIQDLQEGFDQCEIQIIVAELLIDGPDNTVVHIFTQKMQFSNVDISFVRSQMQQILSRSERECKEVIAFFRSNRALM